MILAERRAKIVCTIGPATNNPDALEKLIKVGMSVARLNFSHGEHEKHLEVIQSLRQISKKLNAPLTILQDLQGPKVRVGQFKDGKIMLQRGVSVQVTTKKILGEDGLIPSDFAHLIESCKVGTRILLDDGLLELEVAQLIDAETLTATVIHGGVLKDRKGMNLPGSNLPIPSMTEKDHKDLLFGLKNQVDYVALSFVRTAQDITELKEIIQKNKSQAKVISKIEMLEAIENLEEIIRVSDAVMVARGDLAIEVGQSRLPGLQKRIIRLANQMGKPVITATQMLDSMVENPRPTRAEITDVANAVLDGTDALMLSAETASGKFPCACVSTMHEIVVEVERNQDKYNKLSLEDQFLSGPASIGASCCLSAMKMNAKAIVCLTTTGKTAQIISSFRPKARIIAVTNELDVLNQLELVWGMQTLHIEKYQSFEDVLQRIEKVLIQYGLAKVGDRIVVSLGMPVEDDVKTNTMFVHELRDLAFAKQNETEIPYRLRKLESLHF
jgi:pyruvate kinase